MGRPGAAVSTHSRVTSVCMWEYPSTLSMSHLTRMRIATARCRWMPAVLLVLSGSIVSPARAQGSSGTASESGWRVSGEVGGVFGGQWLSGASAPRVSTDAGLALSVAAHHRAFDNVSAGISFRGAMQGITMEEAGVRWSGGTSTDVQALGTVAVALFPTGAIVTDLELGGGLSVLTGTRTVFPFSEVSRFAPVAEAGLALALGGTSEMARRYRPFALVVRYGVLRVDANGGSANLPNSMTTGAGWVGRTTIALRLRQ